MTHTEYRDPNVDHTSWMQWVEENLDRAKKFYREVIVNLKGITKKTIFKVSEELRFFVSKLTVLDFVCVSITLAVMAFASLFLVSGLGLIGYQVFLWMKDGIWPEFSIEVVFNFLFENTSLAQWLSNPESWFGLQKITEWLLENIPLSVALIVPSIFTLVGMMCITIAALAFRFYQFKTEKKLNPI